MKDVLMSCLLLVLYCAISAADQLPTGPGCFLLGHTRNISIPGCVIFELRANMCYGFCDSFSIATGPEELRENPHQDRKSIASCCDMDETEVITKRTQCPGGVRTINFTSPISCSCSQCKKN